MRHSGIEALRLVIMFGIVMSHWGGHGSFSMSDNYELSANFVWLQLAQIFGGLGTTTFVLISGYFSYGKTDINWSGIRRVAMDVRFYALTIWLITFICGFITFHPSQFVGAIFPVVVFPQYWFVLPYLLVCLLSPLLNKIVSKAPTNQLIALLAVLVLAEFIFPVIGRKYFESQLVRFTAFYVIGACLNKYQDRLTALVKYRWYLLVLSFCSIVLICVLVDVLGYPEKYGQLAGTRTPFVILMSIGIFTVFHHFKFKSSIVNNLAKSSFAIYLISESPNIFPWFWKEYFECMDYFDSPYMIPMSILQCLLVCACCILIDMLCKKIRLAVKLDSKIENFENRIINRIFPAS